MAASAEYQSYAKKLLPYAKARLTSVNITDRSSKIFHYDVDNVTQEVVAACQLDSGGRFQHEITGISFKRITVQPAGAN